MPGTGSGVLDFGAFPGASDASVTITGLTGIATNSRVEAYVEPNTSPDHSADEHMVETIKVFADASTIVAGTSCVVRGFNTSQLNEPIPSPIVGTGAVGVAAQAPGFGGAGKADAQTRARGGGQGTRIYGKFNVGLAWA